MDYRKPFADKVDIAIVRARATNRAKRIGVVVTNPGGPGISGVDFVIGGIQAPAFARIRERFDIVSFDPRGVARSRAIRCDVDFPGIPFDSDDLTLAAAFDEVSRLYAQACFEQNGRFAGLVGTNNTARDIDMIRRALGERQITYAAGSYGSELGAVYASLYPERVRAMLLDGGIAPEFRDNLVEMLSEYSGGFELSFQHVDALCRRDPQCALADVGLVATFDEVAARLKAAPVTSPDGRVLTAGLMSDLVGRLLGSEGNYRLMVVALANARAGDYGLFFLIAPLVSGGPGADSLYAVWCSDYGTRRSAAEYLPVDEALGGLHPRFFGRFFVALSVAPCAAWQTPADVPIIRNVRHEVDVPILIIGNDFDPNTPLADARRMAHALGMERSLVRYVGGGHTAFAKTTACVQETIERYLFDLRVPPEGFTCPGQPISFGPSSSLQRGSETGSTDALSVMPRGLWDAPPIVSPFAGLKVSGR
jgi:pimeloyl-ACP methyl ester carboxylesterase